MTRRKLTLFLAVTAVALQPDIARGFPSQRYSPYLMQSTRQNAVDIPDSNTYRFLKQMELDQIMQRLYSSDELVNSDPTNPGVPLSPDLTPEEGLDVEMKMALQESNIDARRTDFSQRAYYGKQPESMYRANDPMRSGGVKFVSERDALRQGLDMGNNFPVRAEDILQRMNGDDMENIGGGYSPVQAEDILQRMNGDDMENIGGGYSPVRAEDILQRMNGDDMENIGGGYSPVRAEDILQRMNGDDMENIGGGYSPVDLMTRQQEIEEKNIFREEDSVRQQELLDQAIRQEEMLQDVALREASSLRQINALRNGDDPLQQFEIARDAFIYKEEIRQDMLQQQALRQEILRQEALRQEKVFQLDPERQVKALLQESNILQQLIQQEDLRQENARNLEDAYRDAAEIRQDDPEAEQMLLQKAQLQESIRQESENRQEEAIRQSDLLRKKVYNKKKILQQVCINCGPKIVSVSNSHNIKV